MLLHRTDGVLEERTVTTGLANWEHTEITAGLKEGDQIVMSLDREGVKAGIRVQREKKSRLNDPACGVKRLNRETFRQMSSNRSGV